MFKNSYLVVLGATHSMLYLKQGLQSRTLALFWDPAPAQKELAWSRQQIWAPSCSCRAAQQFAESLLTVANTCWPVHRNFSSGHATNWACKLLFLSLNHPSASNNLQRKGFKTSISKSCIQWSWKTTEKARSSSKLGLWGQGGAGAQLACPTQNRVRPGKVAPSSRRWRKAAFEGPYPLVMPEQYLQHWLLLYWI